jgi:hypothetical protein
MNDKYFCFLTEFTKGGNRAIFERTKRRYDPDEEVLHAESGA